MRAQSADETVATLDRSASNLQKHIERSRDSQKRVEESVKETLKRCVLTTDYSSFQAMPHHFNQCSLHSVVSFSVEQSLMQEMRTLIRDELMTSLREQQNNISTNLLDAVRSGEHQDPAFHVL